MRRAAAIVVVLLMISITLVISYAVMRSQATMLTIQHNSDSRARAHQAAITGLAIGLRKMHESGWVGVGHTISGQLNATDRYTVSYTTGDPRLTSSDADYADLPFRVTLLATGIADDPGGESSAATHQAQAIVRLVPRELAADPNAWSELNSYTVYQYRDDDFEVDVPCRVEGPVRIRGDAVLGEHYAWYSSIRNRYFSDLEAMRGAGLGDLRPFSGPLVLPLTGQSSTTLSLLQGSLGLSVTDDSASALSGWDFPGYVSSYRIYPGGKLYYASICGTTLNGAQLVPDPATNPLGVYICTSSVRCDNSVTLKGTLIVGGNLDFYGSNINCEPVDLPALDGTDEPVQLPTLLVAQRMHVRENCRMAVKGMIACWDRFYVVRGSSSASFDLRGNLVTKEFVVRERESWDMSDGAWNFWYNFFLLSQPSSTFQYLPTYFGLLLGMNPTPKIVLAPHTQPVRSHWQTNGASVYVVPSQDAGLRWDLLHWQDNL